MQKLFCLITGDDYQMLTQETPASRKKVALLACSLVVPVLIWLIITFLMAKAVLGYSSYSALVAALLSAVIIFVIEKSIIMADGSRWLAWFRIGLGCVTALIGALCMDEVFFEGDIDRQMAAGNEAEKQAVMAGVEQRYQPLFEDMNQQIAVKYAAWQQALADEKAEADGSGGSGKSGVGAIAKLKQQIAAQNEAEYGKAKAALAALREKTDREKETAAADLAATFNDHSLLLRIKALFNLVFSDIYMGVIYFIFTLFFFFLEFLVVILKLCSKETNYERRVRLIEEIGEKRMRLLGQSEAMYDMGQYHPVGESSRGLLRKGQASVFK